MLSVSNELAVISEEMSFKRNELLSKLYKAEGLVEQLNDQSPGIPEFKKAAKEIIAECYSILEDIQDE